MFKPNAAVMSGVVCVCGGGGGGGGVGCSRLADWNGLVLEQHIPRSAL
jgi:hypothetical protein